MGELASGGVHSFVGGSAGVNSYAGMSRGVAAYRLWDADKLTRCVCDRGYGGADCSERACPLGDDPLTAGSASCGSAPCADEVQGFTLSGYANDGGAYRLRFTDFWGAVWLTAPFAVATDTASSAAQAANAAAIKGALESLPAGVAGNVTAACGSDYSAVPNVRCTVTFVTLPGNVPELVVVPAGGAPVVAQPAQPVHVFAAVAGSATPGVGVALRLFPDDLASGAFRAAQYVGAATAAGATTSGADIAAAVADALQGAAGASAFTYTYGGAAAAVTAGPLAAGAANVVVVLPARALGAMRPMRLTFNGASYTSVLDMADGNKETLPCSNRGTCDAAAGLCRCFTGYTGHACESQNVLAV